MSTAAQVRRIHTLASQAGLEDGDYRALVLHHGGATSSKDLDVAGADRVIKALLRLPGADRAPAATRASGRYAPILQALWLTAWDLGIVRDRSDRAMMRFVARQTGLDHIRFLADPADARRAIQGLKGWITREGGVVWPATDEPAARRFAVCRAITAKLAAAGAFTPFVPGTDPWPADVEFYAYRRGLKASFGDYSEADWLRLTNLLGARLRAALAKTAKQRIDA